MPLLGKGRNAVMEYEVLFVGDDELPTDHDWVLVKAPTCWHFIVKKSAVTPEVILEGWAAYRQLARAPGEAQAASLALA